jgi:hypothetical protein
VAGEPEHARAHPGLVGHQANRLPRDTHADLDLWTDRDPLDQGAKLVAEKRITLVLRVETNLRAQQAG